MSNKIWFIKDFDLNYIIDELNEAKFAVDRELSFIQYYED